MMCIHCLWWKLPGRLDGLFIGSWSDGLHVKGFWGESKKEIELPHSSHHCLLSTETRKEEKGEKKVCEDRFLDLTLLVNNSEVSAPAAGPN